MEMHGGNLGSADSLLVLERVPQGVEKRSGVISHTCNPSLWEAGAGGSPEFRASLDDIEKLCLNKTKQKTRPVLTVKTRTVTTGSANKQSRTGLRVQES